MKCTIDFKAYQKLIFLRDINANEVAAFGQTLPEDALHVVDFHLVKQKVNPVSADVDPEGFLEYTDDMIGRGHLPINSTRFWAHTHPMTGKNSADPSTKDLSTWNDKDNEGKNFLVMFILSRSGETTCRVRIKQNVNIPGVDNIVHEEEIKVVIAKPEEDALKDQLVEIFGEKAYNRLGFEKTIKLAKPEELYPEFVDLMIEYNALVSVPPERSSTINTLTKGIVQSSIPRILFNISKSAKSLADADLDRLARLYSTTKESVQKTERLFFNFRSEPSWERFFDSLINNTTIVKSEPNSVFVDLNHKDLAGALEDSAMLYDEFEGFALNFNRT